MAIKVLTLDIETTPLLGHTWGLWNQNIGLNQVVTPTRLLCFAAKWHGDRRSHFHNGDDMVTAAHALLEECDVLVTYNGKKFDVPHLEREFLEAGLPPPKPFHHIDLYQAMKRFKFTSHKLDHIVQRLGLGAKVSHAGFPLWLGCMAGDEKAWRSMRRYNIQDVKVTEALYDRVRPWIKNHPHPGLFSPELADCCPKCGSPELEKRGFKATGISVFQQYRCTPCGGWSRGKTALSRVETRNAL